MAEIFVSYTSSDRDWAAWIGHELIALGHKPHIHEWEIEGGSDVYAWMQERFETADRMLCVVSEEYLKAPYSTLDRNAGLWRGAKEKPGFVLIAVVKPCKLPALLAHLSRRDLHGIAEGEARARLKSFFGPPGVPPREPFPGNRQNAEPAQSLTGAAPPFPGAIALSNIPITALSNIPISVPRHFLGRDEALAAIDAALTQADGRAAITALHGLRGVGKTTLAAAYAERHRGDYRATWWIRAQTEPSMRADLAALGVRLGWVAADAKEEPALAAVMERLRHEGDGVLLIFANAIDAASIRSYLPRGGARVLVTSNSPTWRAVATPVEIRQWPKQIGADFLLARTGRVGGERAAAEALSETLGGLPLAHEQAGAYCERLGVSFAEYRKRFLAAPVRLLDDVHSPIDHNDSTTAAKSFALAIDEASKLHPAAEALIVHAALLAPEPIPLFLFAEAQEEFDEPLASALAGDGLDEVVAALRTFALVDRETIPDERDPAITTDTIRLHRLVREVAAARQMDSAREVAGRALLRAMALVYPRDVHDDPNSWPRARRLDSLALALAGGDEGALAGAEQQVSDVATGLARYRRVVLAAYAEARALYERALAIREKVLGPEHPETVTSLNNLANLVWRQGDHARARSLCERALATCENLLGPEHPDTAQSLNNLGNLLSDQGDLAGARPLYERALAIREKVLGPEHPETAQSLHNLASLLQAQGDLAGARPLYKSALAIDEKRYGPDHPEVGTDLDSLASLLRAQGDLAGARSLHERALAIREKVLGPEHPDTAQSLNNLGTLLQEQGDLAGARRLCERALAIREKVLGREHPDTADSLNDLGFLFAQQGDLAGARPLYERALATYEKALGPEHPRTVTVRNNLANLQSKSR